MPRRHLSEQQQKRIRAIQERRLHRRETRTEEQLAELEPGAPKSGRVVVRHGANLAVTSDHGPLVHCVSRRHVGEPVCGDRVIWQPTNPGHGVITAIEPRLSLLSRPDNGRAKPLAANLSLVVIVFAPEPPPTGDLLDHYLVAAETIGVEALLLCNKADLLASEDENNSALHERLAEYRGIGYPLLHLSARDGLGLEELRCRLREQIGILVGQSGVGKSSIAQALLPDQEVQIGQLSRATGLGRHTTSAATCYRLPSSGHLIDSPGVRSFRLPPLTRAQLEQGFREFRPHIGGCRFANCGHHHEPDCALRTAVDEGLINPRRLQVFQRLLASTNTGGQP